MSGRAWGSCRVLLLLPQHLRVCERGSQNRVSAGRAAGWPLVSAAAGAQEQAWEGWALSEWEPAE